MSASDRTFMSLAIAMARRGLGRTWPNPSVGAVLVSGDDPPGIISRGWTQPGGRPHAEVVALKRAGMAAEGATLYVTLEPCAHHGKTPPCVDAIIASGVKRVVCGITDPDPRVAGQGIERLAEAGIEVVTGVMARSVGKVTAGHIRRIEEGRPHVTLKTAVGSDGLVARGDGSPVWVTGEEARANGHLLRARNDAILVGRGTVEADDPSLTCRLAGMAGRSPVRVILDSNLSVRQSSKMFAAKCADAPVWIFCREDALKERESALRDAGAEIMRMPASITGYPDVVAICSCLASKGITRLLVEGGPSVAKSFLESGCVDEIALYMGSKPAGKGALKAFGDKGVEILAGQNSLFGQISTRALGSDRLQIFEKKPH